MIEPATPPPSGPSASRVLVFASYQYLNYAAVLSALGAIPNAEFAVASQVGVGHSLLKLSSEHSLHVSPLKWQPTRPHLTIAADRAIIFWDGHDRALLPSVVVLRKASVPLTIVGPDGNEIDLAQFCATLTNGNGGNTTVATPTVIVDQPSSPANREAKVIVKLAIPDATFTKYDDQAKLARQSPEKIMSDRLRQCVEHTSGRGLYFNDEERSHLERITGGHLISSAGMALEKVKIVVNLKVGDIQIELTERVLARATSRAKSMRLTLEEYVRKEVQLNLEKSVGLRPW